MYDNLKRSRDFEHMDMYSICPYDDAYLPTKVLTLFSRIPKISKANVF